MDNTWAMRNRSNLRQSFVYEKQLARAYTAQTKHAYANTPRDYALSEKQ